MSWVEMVPEALNEVFNNPNARGYLDDVAEAGKNYAQSIAPVLTGQYRDSFSAEVTQSEHPVAIIANNDPIWYYLEFGTIHNQPYRCLTNALQHISDPSKVVFE